MLEIKMNAIIGLNTWIVFMNQLKQAKNDSVFEMLKYHFIWIFDNIFLNSLFGKCVELNQMVNTLHVASFSAVVTKISYEMLEHFIERLIVPAYRNEKQSNYDETFRASFSADTDE